MGGSKYIYTFVKSGAVPEPGLVVGTKRPACIENAKAAAVRDSHTQDIFRRSMEDAQGHKVPDENRGWEKLNTVGEPDKSQVSIEAATVSECIKAITAEMPNEQTAKEVRIMHFRRDGMIEAVQAIKKHFGLKV